MNIRLIKALTLIEVMVAVTIFSLLSVSLYLLLNTGIFVKEKIEVQQNTLQNMYLGLERISRDLRNAVCFREKDSGFKGDGKSLEFYTLSFDWNADNPEDSPKISKVSYSVKDEYIPEKYITKKIVAKTVYELFEEKKENQEKSYTPVLSDVSDISFFYFYIEGVNIIEKEDWNLEKEEDHESSEEKKKPFPQGVKIKLTCSGDKGSDFSVEKYVYLYNDSAIYEVPVETK